MKPSNGMFYQENIAEFSAMRESITICLSYPALLYFQLTSTWMIMSSFSDGTNEM